ncbi:hypothetical protein [Rhizobacter sp. P5_C2]
MDRIDASPVAPGDSTARAVSGARAAGWRDALQRAFVELLAASPASPDAGLPQPAVTGAMPPAEAGAQDARPPSPADGFVRVAAAHDDIAARSRFAAADGALPRVAEAVGGAGAVRAGTGTAATLAQPWLAARLQPDARVPAPAVLPPMPVSLPMSAPIPALRQAPIAALQADSPAADARSSAGSSKTDAAPADTADVAGARVFLERTAHGLVAWVRDARADRAEVRTLATALDAQARSAGMRLTGVRWNGIAFDPLSSDPTPDTIPRRTPHGD